MGSPPPAAPNVNQRAQLASLFPGDITSGLIKAQQPTQFMQDGGAVYNLREAPGVDDLRALTLEEFKNFTFQQLLNLKSKKDQEVDKFNNPIKYLTQDFALGMNTPAAIAKFKQESLEKANELEQQIQRYGMDREVAIKNYPQALASNAPVSMRRKQDIESGNVQITGFPDYLVKPMQDGGAAYDMGLETDLAAQESIMSALDYNDNNQSDFTPTFPSTFSYTPSNQGAGITSVRTNPLVQNIIDSFKLGNTQIIPEFGKNKVGVTFKRSFADGGIVGLAFGGVSERPGGMDLTPQDYADYMSDAQRTVGRTNYDDAMAEETARQIAAPQVGVSRSNIIGSDTYDPQFAQALNISQGLLPGNKNLRFGAQRRDDIIRDIGVNEFNRRYGQGVPSLNLPSKLVPQYDGGQYFSFGEKALMEPEGLLSLLMPGGFIRPFLESNFMQGIRKFLPSTKETVTKKTAPSLSYSRSTLPEKGMFGGEIVTNPVIALAFGIMQNENINDFSDAYRKAQVEYSRRRGRVNEIVQ